MDDGFSKADWAPPEKDEEIINKDADQVQPVEDLFEDFLENLREAGREQECSCGADIIGFKNHSDFCPKYKRKPFQT